MGGELCVTAVRSNKDPINPANQNQISMGSASSIMTKTSQSVTRDLGYFQGGALEVTSDRASFQGVAVEEPWTTVSQPSTRDTKERECSMLCDFFSSKYFCCRRIHAGCESAEEDPGAWVKDTGNKTYYGSSSHPPRSS